MEKYKVIRDSSPFEVPAVNFISTHMRSSAMPWFYRPYTVPDTDVFYHHELIHIYEPKDNWLYYHNLLGPNKGEQHIDTKIIQAIRSLDVIPEYKTHKLLRAQANCVHRTKGPQISVPHRDFHTPGCVYIYYVNDSDGDTVLFDENGELEATITPKAGHMVRMDSKQYHSGTTPVRSERRFVINLCFEEI